MMQENKIHKVLVIDDDSNILRLLKYNLEKANYKVITAVNGDKGLAAMSEQRPDIVLLDVSMPGLNGMEVCQRIKSDDANKYVPVILVTAKSELSDRVEGFTAGADDYICKPFELEELRSRLAAHLRTRQLLEELVDHAKQIATIEGVRRTLLTMSHYINNANQSVFGRAQLCEKYPDDESFRTQLVTTCLRQIPKVTAVIKAIETLVADLQFNALPYESISKGPIWDIEDKINSVLTGLTKKG